MNRDDVSDRPDAHKDATKEEWQTPKLTRLVAGEAELNPVFTTDSEGTS